MAEFLVVGAGFAGAVAAREVAEAGFHVLVIDKRQHIGGNAFDELDSAGILVHRYGPHIFHTNAQRIFDYLSRFTQWRAYEHRVLASINGNLLPFPINRATLNRLYGLELDEEGTRAFLDKVRERRARIISSEDLILDSVGQNLYETFYLNYTRKQWGIEPSELKAAVAARIPIRCNDDDRYFTDKYQAIPADGYTALFRNLLDHPNIRVELETDYLNIKPTRQSIHTIFTGPIDQYFGHCFGPLPYRSLRFEHVHLCDRQQFQPVATVNYPNDNDYTRITEFKYLTGQGHQGTSIVYEYPTDIGEPYYPIPQEQNEHLFRKYDGLASRERNVTFVGRLAQYRYYNMDQVVAASLKAVQRLTSRAS